MPSTPAFSLSRRCAHGSSPDPAPEVARTFFSLKKSDPRLSYYTPAPKGGQELTPMDASHNTPLAGLTDWLLPLTQPFAVEQPLSVSFADGKALAELLVLTSCHGPPGLYDRTTEVILDLMSPAFIRVDDPHLWISGFITASRTWLENRPVLMRSAD
ncbi:hypothetical protein N658DRAFT_331837 [Parathielavia hyrcaniae]|uniref:Uncharacterized protein n=1 Tax=Parathielavia hyrcaniae TaxID=113614 RepID=A0AAN6PSC9_9PEZI|nr:hypothetical protein N658DRAFT_331837 [Parathielavia hyrcaniae]